MSFFVDGRKKIFSILEDNIVAKDQCTWVHTASLGEYEQAVPVISELKKIFPEYKIVLSFFSPSGYEVKKNKSLADIEVYLPLDTPQNVNRFLDTINPEWVLFIKYDFWPNYLLELKKRKIKTVLISGRFRKGQIFFRSYGNWWRDQLQAFDRFFVQDQISRNLLNSVGFSNVVVSGDTRFDRVTAQLRYDNSLGFMSKFKDEKICLVAGSTWPEDEQLLANFINSNPEIKFVIAPHSITKKGINTLLTLLEREPVIFSEMEGKDLPSYQVFIMNRIGYLTRIYSYSDIAYVGGAAGSTGLHNILEPATFGVPIVIGENYSKFPEAGELKNSGGLFSVSNQIELENILGRLIDEEKFRIKTGKIAERYVLENSGSTKIIMEYFLKKS